MTQALLSVKDLRCDRGGRTLFQNLSFDMGAGDVLQVTGANGAGKTSLLRVLAGRLPVEGSAHWQSKEVSENNVQNVSLLLSDDRGLKVLETAEENLNFWRGVWGAGDIDAALQAADLLPLKKTAVRFFSAGQKRRLSLAIVYLKATKLWLLDEPLNGLDAAAQEKFFAQLASHAANGGVAVIASHQDIPAAKKLHLAGAA